MKNTHSKGQTLKFLRGKLKLFKVPELLIISFANWENNRRREINKINETFKKRTLVVRSSASDEDSEFGAKAGAYESVLNIEAGNESALTQSIERVFSSYRNKGKLSEKEEVFAQEMVGDVVLSGVIFTYELNTGALIM